MEFKLYFNQYLSYAKNEWGLECIAIKGKIMKQILLENLHCPPTLIIGIAREHTTIKNRNARRKS